MSNSNPEVPEPESLVVPTQSQSVGGKDSLGGTAAQLSWQLPIGSVVVNVIASLSEDQSQLFGWICSGLILLGFIAGILALFSVVRYGWRHILIPAVFGISINGFLIWMTVMAILQIRASQ